MIQKETDLDNNTHEHERTETVQHLHANMDRFSKQAKMVYDLMMSGERLTLYRCMNEFGIASVSARVSDLKKAGVNVQKEWEVTADGKRTKNRIYFIEK